MVLFISHIPMVVPISFLKGWLPVSAPKMRRLASCGAKHLGGVTRLVAFLDSLYGTSIPSRSKYAQLDQVGC